MSWAWCGVPGVDDSGITRSSFAGAGGVSLWALSWAWDIFCVSFVHLCLSPLLGCMTGGC